MEVQNVLPSQSHLMLKFGIYGQITLQNKSPDSLEDMDTSLSPKLQMVRRSSTF